MPLKRAFKLRLIHFKAPSRKRFDSRGGLAMQIIFSRSSYNVSLKHHCLGGLFIYEAGKLVFCAKHFFPLFNAQNHFASR